MKNFLAILIFLPLIVFGATFAWVAREDAKLQKSLDVGMPAIGPEPQTEDLKVKEGWKVFNIKGCVYCHGPNGAGGVNHPNAVGGQIPSLSRVAEGYSEEELKEKILKGVREISKDNPQGPTPPLYMPIWQGHVNDEEMENLVAFLKSLLPKGEKSDEW